MIPYYLTALNCSLCPHPDEHISSDLVDTIHFGHVHAPLRAFFDNLIDMAWAWGWAQAWIVYIYCTFTPLRAPPKISSDEGWKNILTTGVDCVELLRLRLRSSHSNRHQASPAPDQRRGKHWSMMELTWPTATRPRPRLSPLAWLRSPETRRDWHRALSLLPRHTDLLCLAT